MLIDVIVIVEVCCHKGMHLIFPDDEICYMPQSTSNVMNRAQCLKTNVALIIILHLTTFFTIRSDTRQFPCLKYITNLLSP